MWEHDTVWEGWDNQPGLMELGACGVKWAVHNDVKISFGDAQRNTALPASDLVRLVLETFC